MTFLWETKKLLFAKRGTLFLIVFFTLNILLLICTDTPENQAEDTWCSQYNIYLNQLQGPLTAEKEAFLHQEATSISEAKIAYTRLRDDYYNGEIDEQTFLLKQQEFESTLSAENGFNVIYDQYRTIYESPSNRYFTSTNGWNSLLKSNLPSCFLLLGLIVFLAVPLYCQEYRCQMDCIILVTPAGSRCLSKDKPILVILISLIASGMQSITLLLFTVIRYGLPNPNFPLQSIPTFNTCSHEFTLWQAALMVFFCRAVGAVFFAIMTAAISVFVKDTTLTSFLSASIAVLPLLGLSETQQYALPLPTTFLQASGFLRGSIIEQNELGETVYLFREISRKQFMLLMAILICAFIVFWFLIRYKSQNYWHREKR